MDTLFTAALENVYNNFDLSMPVLFSS